jgi:hypothetical protein
VSIESRASWASYGTAKKETLKLFPPARILIELEKDYALMESMFFREIPAWELILKTIEQFEKEFNKMDSELHGCMDFRTCNVNKDNT